MLRRHVLAGVSASLCAAAAPSVFAQKTSADTMSTMPSVPHHAISADGTTIAYWSTGNGPPLVFVVGAFNDHTTGSELAGALSSRFTVITYDRRGRGASGDAAGYAIEREVEDLAADPPRVVRSALDRQRCPPRPRADMADHLRGLIDAGKRGEAVEVFQLECAGIPEDVVVQMCNAPFRPALEAIAHTLVYEATIMGNFTVPDGLLPRISQPSLILHGGKSPAWMAATAAFVADALPDGRVEVIPEIAHDLTPALALPVTAFLGS